MATKDVQIEIQIAAKPPDTCIDSCGDVAGAKEHDKPTSPRDPQMQVLFDQTVCKELELPYLYQQVNVLIIRWADYLDRDLKCGDEVKELREVFEEQYHYNTKVLTLDDKKDPGFQLSTGINSFIRKHDGPCRTHLLIIYYTGHGNGAEDGLMISGVRDPSLSAIAPKHHAEAHWGRGETGLIEHTDADVLMIMDCCCAGMVVKGAMEDLRTFELLAAATKGMATAGPGRRSFSRAMIDALKEQLQDPDNLPFTTFDLNNKIIRRRGEQGSQVYPRLNTRSHRFIKLAPLNSGVVPKPVAAPLEASYLTLRFSFEKITALQPKQTVRLAKALSKASLETKLGINRIEWLDAVENKPSKLYKAVMKAQRLWRAQERPCDRPTKRVREEEPTVREEPASKRARQPLTPSSGADWSGRDSPA